MYDLFIWVENDEVFLFFNLRREYIFVIGDVCGEVVNWEIFFVVDGCMGEQVVDVV